MNGTGKRRDRRRVIILGKIIVGFLLIALGFFLGRYGVEKRALLNTKKIEKREIGYKYISPLLECESYNGSLDYNFPEIQKKTKKIIDSHIAKKNVDLVSLYLRDLNNGPWMAINGENKFSPASLLKVPLMMAYFRLAEEDETLLNKKLVVQNYQEEVSPNILPQKTVQAGEEYSVEELISYMIKYSDNVAANTLLTNISTRDIENIYNDFGLKVPGSGETENFMTVMEYSSFFRTLYNASYLNRKMSEKALKLLTSPTFTQGIVAGLPRETLVAHKFGERVFENKKQLHDCGIIYSNKGNYLLCIMTKGDDFKKMEEAIANISKNVFHNLNSFTN